MLRHNFALRSRVPERLWGVCSDAERPDVTVRTMDAFSQDDLLLLARAGVGLTLHAESIFDLRSLGESLRFFRYIALLSRKAGSYINAQILSQATRCRELHINAQVDADIDLEHLVKLEEFSCDQGIGWSAARNKRLLNFWATYSAYPRDLEFRGKLRRLTLGGAKALTQIPQLAAPTALRHLSIQDAESFDISSMSSAKNLLSLEFVNCRQLLNVNDLVRLGKLQELRIHGTRDIPNYESVLTLDLPSLGVSNNRVFEEPFREQARLRGWKISPFLSSSQNTLANRPDSYAPFELHLDSGDGSQVITFDDWAELEDRLSLPPGDESTEVVQRMIVLALGAEGRALFADNSLEFDSESDFVLVRARATLDVKQLAEALADAWNDPAKLRALYASASQQRD